MHINNKDILFNKVCYSLRIKIMIFFHPLASVFQIVMMDYTVHLCRRQENLSSDFVGGVLWWSISQRFHWVFRNLSLIIIKWKLEEARNPLYFSRLLFWCWPVVHKGWANFGLYMVSYNEAFPKVCHLSSGIRSSISSVCLTSWLISELHCMINDKF